jgi:hypothetical protein
MNLRKVQTMMGIAKVETILSFFLFLLFILPTSFVIIFVWLPLSRLLYPTASPNLLFFEYYQNVRNILLGLNQITLVPLLTALAIRQIYKGESFKTKLVVFFMNIVIFITFFFVWFKLADFI